MQFGQFLRNKVPKDALFMGFLGFFRGDYFRASSRKYFFKHGILCAAQLPQRSQLHAHLNSGVFRDNHAFESKVMSAIPPEN
jgi:hypothetical protein